MAARVKKPGDDDKVIQILEIAQGRIECFILGKTPLIMNATSEKVQQGLLLPPVKMTEVTKRTTLKHNPPEEFINSSYRFDDEDDAPTRLYMPATAFKSAMRSVALDMPGSARKAEIGRLTYVEGDKVAIYGIPKYIIAQVRLQDQQRTLDIRTRLILPEWACRLAVIFCKPMLTEGGVMNLLAAAGMLRGVGDWRVEKGAGNYGQWIIPGADNADWLRLVKTGALKAQDAALERPQPYDKESFRLMEWWKGEAKRRELLKVEKPEKKAA